MLANSHSDDTIVGLVLLVVFVIVVSRRRRRWQATTAYGNARWASDKLLRAWGMFASSGLVIGRTTSDHLIRLPRFCHVLLLGSTGSGKGVSVIIPNALAYLRGSLILHDPKGDLLQTVGRRKRRQGYRVISLAPFDGGTDRLNPLAEIRDGPLVVDRARALAESLVIRTGKETETHWNDRAVVVITAIMVYVLKRLTGPERTLSSVQEIASDAEMLAAMAEKLRAMGDIAGRLGSQVKTLYDRDGGLSREGSSVLSTVTRHLSFLDSEAVSAAVSDSTFDVRDLLKPRVALFLRISPEHLEAQKGLLRCWIATIFREICSSGSETSSEVLALLDEASCLDGLSIIEETLVRGRSAGLRLLLAYQSESQVKAAFPDKPSLIFDNCDTQLILGVNSLEGAERLSKMLGSYTNVLDSYGENESQSQTSGREPSSQTSRGTSASYSLHERALMRVEELLRMSGDDLLCLHRGLPQPVMAQRIKYYADPTFTPGAKRPRKAFTLPRQVWWWVGAAVLLGLVVCAPMNGCRDQQRSEEVFDGEDWGRARGGDGTPGVEGTPRGVQPEQGQRGSRRDGDLRNRNPGRNRQRP